MSVQAWAAQRDKDAATLKLCDSPTAAKEGGGTVSGGGESKFGDDDDGGECMTSPMTPLMTPLSNTT